MGFIIISIIAIFLGLAVLGFFINLAKRSYRELRANFLLYLPIIPYVWVLIEYPKPTLWTTGGIIALVFIVAFLVALNDTRKTKQLIIPLANSNNISKLKSLYAKFSNSEKRDTLNAIAESQSQNKSELIKQLFLMDFLKIVSKNANKNNLECLMERSDLEGELAKVWEGRIDDVLAFFDRNPLQSLELELIIPNRGDKKSKEKPLELVKIKKRQPQDDFFSGAIEI